jgi:hypothetical protein
MRNFPLIDWTIRQASNLKSDRRTAGSASTSSLDRALESLNKKIPEQPEPVSAQDQTGIDPGFQTAPTPVSATPSEPVVQFQPDAGTDLAAAGPPELPTSRGRWADALMVASPLQTGVDSGFHFSASAPVSAIPSEAVVEFQPAANTNLAAADHPEPPTSTDQSAEEQMVVPPFQPRIDPGFQFSASTPAPATSPKPVVGFQADAGTVLAAAAPPEPPTSTDRWAGAQMAVPPLQAGIEPGFQFSASAPVPITSPKSIVQFHAVAGSARAGHVEPPTSSDKWIEAQLPEMLKAMSSLHKAVVGPDINTPQADRDRAVALRWVLRDIRSGRSRSSPIDKLDLEKLVIMGFVEMRGDVPVLNDAGLNAII